jgi:hypothetical protein
MPKISHYVNALVETYQKLPEIRVRSSYWGRAHVNAWALQGTNAEPLYVNYAYRVTDASPWQRDFHDIVAAELGATSPFEENYLDFVAAINGPARDRRTPRVHRIRRMILQRLARVENAKV